MPIKIKCAGMNVLKNGQSTSTDVVLNGGYPYVGEKIAINHSFIPKKLMSWKHGFVEGNQAAAVYGKYMFQFSTDVKRIAIYDMETKERLQIVEGMEMAGFHANSAFFGNEKYDSTDRFPVMYVSGTYQNKAHGYRITGADGNMSLTLVQTINFTPTSSTNGFINDVCFDSYNGFIIETAYNRETYFMEDGLELIYKVYRMPKLSDGAEVSLDPTKMIGKACSKAATARQGGYAKCGKMYVPFGNGTSAPSMMWCVDYTTGRILSVVSFDGEGIRDIVKGEVESVFEYDGYLTVNTQSDGIVRLIF